MTSEGNTISSSSAYGIGYGWSPSVSHITVGDEIEFYWVTPVEDGGIPIGVFSTDGAASTVYNENGFNFPAGLSGINPR